ncbi:ribonuclease H family protein [Agromyces sp. SYSU T00194]|uniref:ribonuclease H family protein n=1 Tax=Agromyces chitinivorans TaxID=3158560 RepID=UPI00339B24AF
MIIAAADGSALGNPGPAGWAWYVDDGCWAAGGWPHGTNNQGELTAVLELLRATAHLDDELVIHCDSRYVIDAITKWMPGWKRKGWRKRDGSPVLNLEIMQALDAEFAGRNARFEWVRGHTGHDLNEAADDRARAAATAYQRKTEVPTGPGWSNACVTDASEGDASNAATDAPEPDAPETATDAPEPTPADADAQPAPAGPTPAATTARASATSASTAPAGATPAATKARSSATPASTSARGPAASARPDRADDDAALFDFDEPEADWRTLQLELTTEEHTRLTERARAAGITPEEFLRGLI